MKLTIIRTFLLLTLCGGLFISCEEEQEPPKVPDAPSRLVANVISSNVINITWQDNSEDEDGFIVERGRFDSLPNIYPIGIVGPNETSFRDSGLISLTSYVYRIQAYNSLGSSRFSTVVLATTQATPVVPNTPLDLKAIPLSESRAFISWRDNSNNEEGFIIERTQPGGTQFFALQTISDNKSSYEDRTVLPASTYQYRISAYNNVGASNYSNIVTVTPGSNVIPPFAPSDLSARPLSSTQVNITWKDNSPNEDGFRLQQAPYGTTNFTIIATIPAGTTYYQVRNLTPSTEYAFRIQSYNEIGSSLFSNTAISATPSVIDPPLAPTGLTVIALSATQIYLRWSDNADNEDGFKIERADNGTIIWNEVATVGAKDTNQVEYVSSGLNPSTSYLFRVRAYNLVGNSDYTATIQQSTPAVQGTPPAPSRLTVASVTPSQVDISWADNSGNEDGFYVERAPGYTRDFVQIATVGITTGVTEHFIDNEVYETSTYSYRVRAFNRTGSSNYTNTVTATTLSGTTTRFINGSSHTIVSLVIDDIQYFPSSPQGISPGTYLPLTLAQGLHTYEIKNGYWIDSANHQKRIELYSSRGSFAQQTGVSGSVSFTDPSIFDILTKSQNTGYWQANFLNTGNVPDSIAFRFFANGTFYLYQSGVRRGNGMYQLVDYGSNYIVIFSANDIEGTLSETENYFTMQNGPSSQPVLRYVYQVR